MIADNDKVTYKIAQQLITNISHSTAGRYIAITREHYKKEPYQILTVKEFKAYWGIQ